MSDFKKSLLDASLAFYKSKETKERSEHLFVHAQENMQKAAARGWPGVDIARTKASDHAELNTDMALLYAVKVRIEDELGVECIFQKEENPDGYEVPVITLRAEWGLPL